MTARDKISVLVAEDEQDLLLLLKKSIEDAGYAVTAAKDGGEAISLIGMNSFDVALLDIEMPNASGIDVLRRLRERSPGTKAIMLTGFADLKYAMEAREHGAVDFINKPFKPEDIVATIKRILKT